MWAVDDRHRQASTAPHSTAPMDFAAVSLARSFACSQVFNYSLNHRLDFLLLRSPHSSIVKLPQEKLKKSTDQNMSVLSLRKKERKKKQKTILTCRKHPAGCTLCFLRLTRSCIRQPLLLQSHFMAHSCLLSWYAKRQALTLPFAISASSNNTTESPLALMKQLEAVLITTGWDHFSGDGSFAGKNAWGKVEMMLHISCSFWSVKWRLYNVSGSHRDVQADPAGPTCSCT